MKTSIGNRLGGQDIFSCQPTISSNSKKIDKSKSIREHKLRMALDEVDAPPFAYKAFTEKAKNLNSDDQSTIKRDLITKLMKPSSPQFQVSSNYVLTSSDCPSEIVRELLSRNPVDVTKQKMTHVVDEIVQRVDTEFKNNIWDEKDASAVPNRILLHYKDFIWRRREREALELQARMKEGEECTFSPAIKKIPKFYRNKRFQPAKAFNKNSSIDEYVAQKREVREEYLQDCVFQPNVQRLTGEESQSPVEWEWEIEGRPPQYSASRILKPSTQKSLNERFAHIPPKSIGSKNHWVDSLRLQRDGTGREGMFDFSIGPSKSWEGRDERMARYNMRDWGMWIGYDARAAEESGMMNFDPLEYFDEDEEQSFEKMKAMSMEAHKEAKWASMVEKDEESRNSNLKARKVRGYKDLEEKKRNELIEIDEGLSDAPSSVAAPKEDDIFSKNEERLSKVVIGGRHSASTIKSQNPMPVVGRDSHAAPSQRKSKKSFAFASDVPGADDDNDYDNNVFTKQQFQERESNYSVAQPIRKSELLRQFGRESSNTNAWMNENHQREMHNTFNEDDNLNRGDMSPAHSGASNRKQSKSNRTSNGSRSVVVVGGKGGFLYPTTFDDPTEIDDEPLKNNHQVLSDRKSFKGKSQRESRASGVSRV